MTKYAYSPNTGEIILTDKIADWMGTTEIEPPAFDKATQSCFFENGAWVVKTAEPEPTPVPEAVSKAQGKAALIQAGHWQAVLNYVDNIEDPNQKALAEIAINDTQEWLRSSPLLNSMAVAIGLSSEDLDDLFIAAANIEF